MAYERTWLVRLHQPIIIGTCIDGVDRHEVIDRLTLRYVGDGVEPPQAEEILDIWRSIDWRRSEPMLMEEFECCDLKGAVKAAQREARERAEVYCAEAARLEALGHPFSHSAEMERMRLVYDRDAEVAE